MLFRLCSILACSISRLGLSYASCSELVRLGACFREQARSRHLHIRAQIAANGTESEKLYPRNVRSCGPEHSFLLV